MTEDTITISIQEYLHLSRCEAKLTALENAGVDNWSGYDDTMEEFREWIREIESDD